MKRLMLVTLIIVMIIGVFSLYSWGADLKIAMLLPGPISDQGWNMMAHNALKAAEKEYNAEIAYTERTPVSDFEEIFRGYAQAGYDIIMGHGFQFGDTAKKVAQEFPKTIFIVSSSDISQAPNLASFRTMDTQAGFIQGVVAALLTKTNKVAYIGGMEIPPTINQNRGFRAGVKYINPSIEVISAFTGSFHDVAKAKEMAKAMAQKEVDIIVPDADVANLGVVEAAEEEGIKIIGCSTDMAEVSPDITITSLLEDFSKAFTTVVGYVLEGKFESRAYEMGVREGALSLAPFRKYEEKVSKEDMAKINQVLNDLKSEKIDLAKYLED